MTACESQRAVGLRVSGLTKVYRSQDRAVVAVKNLSFTVAPSSFVSIIGQSGCGKSTTLMMIAGLEQATSGTVDVSGETITRPYSDAGVVFQRDLLLDWRSAIENVELQFEMRGIKAPAGRALELLRTVGIDEEFARARPRQLSGGMRQRVAIARAMAHDPSLLLMDEPFGALDALTRERLNNDLARVAAHSGKTVLFVTHDIDEAAFLSDTIIVMSSRPGRVLEEVEIDVPRPRDSSFRDSPELLDYSRRVRRLLDTGASA